MTAAAAFGPSSDDVFLTTLAEVSTDVDLATVRELDLVADPASTQAVARLLAQAVSHGVRIRLGVPTGSGDAPIRELADLVTEAGLQVEDTARGTDFGLVGLVPLPEEASPDSARRTTTLVLQALLTPPRRPAPVPQRTPAEESAPARPERPRPRLVNELTRVMRWRSSRKHLVLLGSVVALLLLGLFLLGALAPSTRALVSVGFPLLVALSLVGIALSGYTLLLLARQVDRQTGRLERLIRHDRTTARRRHEVLLRHVRTLEESHRRIAHLEAYLEAVAAHSAASDARMRDIVDQLSPPKDSGLS